MIEKIINRFPDDEKPKRKELVSLLSKFKSEHSKGKISFPGGDIESGDRYFITDGFFPYYFSQKKRILFILRETRYLYDGGVLKKQHENPCCLESIFCHHENNMIRGNTVFRRLFYIAYGVKTEGRLPFEEAKKSFNDFAPQFAIEGGFSFAFMELSKYSNEEDSGFIANRDLISQFFQNSNLHKRNFIRQEIELLSPDVIITGSLWDDRVIDESFRTSVFGNPKKIPGKSSDYAAYFEITIGNKKTPIINLSSFPARRKDKDCYYDPVMSILFRKGGRK